MATDPKETWTPTYDIQVDQDQLVSAAKWATTIDCPVAILSTPVGIQMRAMALEVINARVLRKTTGSFVFGSDASEWPIKWYDFIELAETENMMVENEMKEMIRTPR